MKRSPLKRKTPLSRGPGPKRTGGLSRGKRLRTRNPERVKAASARNFGDEAEAVRALGCVVANHSDRPTPCSGDIVAMHVVSRGAGGGRFDLVGGCVGHHDEQHRVGVESFARKYGLDLCRIADRIAVHHPRPLGLRGIADRWAKMRPFDYYEHEALIGWARREVEAYLAGDDYIAPWDAAAEHLHEMLELDEDDDETAWAIGAAAVEGWDT